MFPSHPASRILLYLLAALAIPGLPSFLLAPLLLFALIADTLRKPWWRSSRSQGRTHYELERGGAGVQLLWRTRWLLLVLFLGYGFSLPGEPALPWLGGFSPSQAGLVHGGLQASRLLLLLIWLDLLVLRLPTPALMAGVYTLLQPFARFGLNVERAALRLGLTLRAIEGLERGRGNLRRLFAEELGSELPTCVHMEIEPMRLFDLALPALIATALLWFSA